MAKLRGGNAIRLLEGGREYFLALERELDKASREVWLETYIFHADASGHRIAQALARAALRGARVRLLLDGFGTQRLDPALAQPMHKAGVQIGVYSPYGSTWRNLLALNVRKARRLHRKLALVDRAVAFCGGINLLDDFIDPNHGPLERPRLDYALRIEGPLCDDVALAVERMWQRVEVWALLRDATVGHEPGSAAQALAAAARQAGALAQQGLREVGSGVAEGARELGERAREGFERLRHPPRHGPGVEDDQVASPFEPGSTSALRAGGVLAAAADGAGEPAAAASGTTRAALLLRDNLRNRHRIERAYLAGLRTARREVLIANAYFLPGRKLRQALVRAAARGVRVRLLLQGRYEYFLQFHATRALYGLLLEHGIELYEYKASFLHAKVAVFDGRLLTVGSSNLDPLSLLLAQEANVLAADPALAAQLRASLEQAIEQGAARVLPEHLARRGLAQRMLDWLAYGLTRLGITLAGKRY
jgi:cardiolipin synthase